MKRVILKKLKLKNFLSIGNEWMEIDIRPGLTFITGFNHDKQSNNGVGKSALFTDSFFFALYGYTLRKLNKNEISNNRTNLPCKSIIAFDIIDDAQKDEYVLMRQLTNPKMQLLKNGENITQNLNETNGVIEKITNASFDVFKYSVVMTLNDSVGFMNQKKSERRAFVESILRLGVFSDMSKLHGKILNESRKEFEIASNRLSDAKRNLLQYEEQTRKQTERREEKIQELKRRLESNTAEIARLESVIANIIIPNISKIQSNKVLVLNKQKELRNIKDSILSNIASFKLQISQAKERKAHIENHGPSCSLCERPFSAEDIKVSGNEIIIIQEKVLKLEEKLEEWINSKTEIEDRLVKCQDAIDDFTEKIRFADSKENELKNIDSRVSQLRIWNTTIKEDLAHVNIDDDNFTELINNVCSNIVEIQSKTEAESDNIDTLEIVKFLLSEEGFRKYIVKKILKLLNSRLAHYLKKLNAPCTCSFNDVFDETIINENNTECSYDSFSGGERKRIDLAMLFTFQDLRRLQSDTAINISVYDELLDSALSGEGVDLTLALLKERSQKYGEAMFIVTHRKENMSLMVDANLIYLEKKEGITTLKTIESSTM